MQKIKCIIGFLLIMFANSQKCERNELEGWKLRCISVETTKDGNNAVTFIMNNKDLNFFWMANGNTAALPVDDFSNTKLAGLYFNNVQMEDIPYVLINSLRDTLTQLWFDYAKFRNERIPDGAFSNCKYLKDLRIVASSVKTVSPNAFVGLDNLERLQLNVNKITFLEKNTFQGLSKLTNLHINSNKLKYVEEGTFDPFSSTIRFAVIHDNPYHCDCSLLWLKHWLKEQKSKNPGFYTGGQIDCNEPIKGNLMTMDFCITPEPTTSTTQPTTSTSKTSTPTTSKPTTSTPATSTPATSTPTTSTPTTSAPTQQISASPTHKPLSVKCNPDDVVSELSELLTNLLEEADCYAVQGYTDEDIILKVKFALEVRRSIMLYQVKRGEKTTRASCQK